MINYFEAAEKTLRARGLLETALGNLERKKERILRYGAPSEYPSADMSKPYTGAKSVNDALADCLEQLRDGRLADAKTIVGVLMAADRLAG